MINIGTLSATLKDYVQSVAISRRSLSHPWRVALAYTIAAKLDLRKAEDLESMLTAEIRPQIRNYLGRTIEIIPFELENMIELTESFWKTRYRAAYPGFPLLSGNCTVLELLGVTRSLSGSTLDILNGIDSKEVTGFSKDLAMLGKLLENAEN